MIFFLFLPDSRLPFLLPSVGFPEDTAFPASAKSIFTSKGAPLFSADWRSPFLLRISEGSAQPFHYRSHRNLSASSPGYFLLSHDNRYRALLVCCIYIFTHFFSLYYIVFVFCSVTVYCIFWVCSFNYLFFYILYYIILFRIFFYLLYSFTIFFFFFYLLQIILFLFAGFIIFLFPDKNHFIFLFRYCSGYTHGSPKEAISA